MLKCHIDKAKKNLRVKAKGTPHDLMVETAAMIETLHQQIHKANPEAANEYKLKLLGVLLDPNTPVWKED